MKPQDLIKLFTIPSYLNTSNTSDVNAWRATRTIIDLYNMVGQTNEEIKTETIVSISSKMRELISEIEPNDKAMLLYELIFKRIEYIREGLLEKEYYWGLQNIKNIDKELDLI
jgi:hypothetical protein